MRNREELPLQDPPGPAPPHLLAVLAGLPDLVVRKRPVVLLGPAARLVEFYLKAMSGVPAEVPVRQAAYRKGGLPGYWKEDERIRRRMAQKVDAIRQAMYYAHMGEKEKAIQQLENLVAELGL